MYVTQFLDCLHLDQKHAFDQQVRAVLADCSAVIVYFYAALLFYREASIAQLLGHGILVDLFQECSPERIPHSERAIDYLSRKIIQPLAICVFRVHLLPSALKCFLRDATTKQ
jgi:hypothetical protein